MNVLKTLIELTGKNASQFAEIVGKHPQQITKNIRDGGDMKLSTLKEFSDKVDTKVNIEIISGNSRVMFKL
jgi:hypothetical protein